jgi:hypothetical protein
MPTAVNAAEPQWEDRQRERRYRDSDRYRERRRSWRMRNRSRNRIYYGYRNYGQYRRTQVGNRRFRWVRRPYWRNGVRVYRTMRIYY